MRWVGRGRVTTQTYTITLRHKCFYLPSSQSSWVRIQYDARQTCQGEFYSCHDHSSDMLGTGSSTVFRFKLCLQCRCSGGSCWRNFTLSPSKESFQWLSQLCSVLVELKWDKILTILEILIFKSLLVYGMLSVLPYNTSVRNIMKCE